jgi:hypothetical protein
LRRKGSKYSNVFDRLKLERIAEDGGRFYDGAQGKYLFLFGNGNSRDKRIGKVILNKKYLSGLFRPKHSEKFKTYCADLRDEDKFLVIQEQKKGELVIYWMPKKRAPQEVDSL